MEVSELGQSNGHSNRFSLLQILVLLAFALLIAIISSLATYWYISNQLVQNNTEERNAWKSVPTISIQQRSSFENGEQYSSKTGLFSLRYNPAWKQFTYTGYATKCKPADNILFLTTTNKNTDITGCGGESPGQIQIVSSSKEPSENGLDASVYSNIVRKSVTVHGVDGVREEGASTIDGMMTTKGSVDIVYTFFTNNRTYKATYHREPQDPDFTTDFDTMIMNTFQFR